MASQPWLSRYDPGVSARLDYPAAPNRPRVQAPTRIEFRESLRRSTVGKSLKRELLRQEEK